MSEVLLQKDEIFNNDVAEQICKHNPVLFGFLFWLCVNYIEQFEPVIQRQ